MISDEAVESGARVLIEDGKFGVPWEDASEDDRGEVMTRVRAILEAAAPHMRRVVTTMQEVDLLPVGSVLLDAFGELLRRDEDDDAPWCDCGGGAFRTVDLPATVLHEPTP